MLLMSIYTISRLHLFENIISTIFQIDNIIIDYEKKLMDALLSQMRYEKKFSIIKDDTLYEQSIAAKNDFNEYIKELLLLSDSTDIRNILNKIKQQHSYYQSLFDDEVLFLKANKEYPKQWYKKEKERYINRITENLKELRVYGQMGIYSKLKKLSETEAQARKFMIVITIVSLFSGIAISTIITSSITNSLSIMKKKTKDIAQGEFKSDLNISSPPEIKELSEAFNIMCGKLREVDKMKSDFFSLMSHELRTPLTSIKEGTNLLLEGVCGEDKEKKRKLLSIIAEESDRLITLVNDILSLSKMESGMLTYCFAKTSIEPLIDKVITEIEPLALAKNIKFEKKFCVGSLLINIDSKMILQALRNLLSNSVKFTSDGGIVSIFTRFTCKGMEVSISDTGVGIPEENLDTIFDKFKQLNLNSNKIKGTGLGLSIVKHIIKAHGGKIWAKSKIGQGSTFTFVLPV